MRRLVLVRIDERPTDHVKGFTMVSIRWDGFEDLEAEIAERDDIVRRRDRGKMPVGSEARARAACKDTYRSKAISRQLGRRTDGMRNRRLRKMD